MNLINHAKEKLKNHELAIGMGARNVRSVDIATIMSGAGYDWLFIDLEHGATSIETASTICIAALAANIAPIVRVPQGDLNLGTRCLDAGALGIVMPHVDTPEQAADMVEAFRFKPMGKRSIAGNYPQFKFENRSASDTVEIFNETTLLIPMIETPQAVANANAIAGTPGIDILLMGTNDLCLEMGIPGEIDNHRISDAVDAVIKACDAHGKWAGLGGV